MKGNFIRIIVDFGFAVYTPIRVETMTAARAGKRAPQLKVWCESCCIRVAPNEERTVVRGKTYHRHCYSKLNAKPKIEVQRVSIEGRGQATSFRN